MALHALGNVRADDRTSTEIADALLQKAEVPFRTGRHFASKLTDFGRGKGLKIHEIPYSEAQRIYEEQAKDKLPLTEAEFREVISAEYMVFGRKGLGGPQTAETKRSIAIMLNHVKKHIEWMHNQQNLLKQRKNTVDTFFEKLLR